MDNWKSIGVYSVQIIRSAYRVSLGLLFIINATSIEARINFHLSNFCRSAPVLLYPYISNLLSSCLIHIRDSRSRLRSTDRIVDFETAPPLRPPSSTQRSILGLTAIPPLSTFESTQLKRLHLFQNSLRYSPSLNQNAQASLDRPYHSHPLRKM